MYLSGSGFRNILIVLIDRFVTARHLVREIFGDFAKDRWSRLLAMDSL
jgi:hypothetical protein